MSAQDTFDGQTFFFLRATSPDSSTASSPCSTIASSFLLAPVVEAGLCPDFEDGFPPDFDDGLECEDDFEEEDFEGGLTGGFDDFEEGLSIACEVVGLVKKTVSVELSKEPQSYRLAFSSTFSNIPVTLSTSLVQSSKLPCVPSSWTFHQLHRSATTKAISPPRPLAQNFFLVTSL